MSVADEVKHEDLCLVVARGLHQPEYAPCPHIVLDLVGDQLRQIGEADTIQASRVLEAVVLVATFAREEDLHSAVPGETHLYVRVASRAGEPFEHTADELLDGHEFEEVQRHDFLD